MTEATEIVSAESSTHDDGRPADTNPAGNAQEWAARLPSRNEQRVILALCVGLGIWIAGRSLALSVWRGGEIEISRPPAVDYQYVVDLNTASWIEFSLLDGIGEKLGRAIVTDRELNGPFRTVDELTRVNGIGGKKLAAIRARLIVSPEHAAAEAP